MTSLNSISNFDTSTVNSNINNTPTPHTKTQTSSFFEGISKKFAEVKTSSQTILKNTYRNVSTNEYVFYAVSVISLYNAPIPFVFGTVIGAIAGSGLVEATAQEYKDIHKHKFAISLVSAVMTTVATKVPFSPLRFMFKNFPASYAGMCFGMTVTEKHGPQMMSLLPQRIRAYLATITFS